MRYIVKEASQEMQNFQIIKQPFQVFDTKGNFVSSSHETESLANRRAAKLNFGK